MRVLSVLFKLLMELCKSGNSANTARISVDANLYGAIFLVCSEREIVEVAAECDLPCFKMPIFLYYFVLFFYCYFGKHFGSP